MNQPDESRTEESRIRDAGAGASRPRRRRIAWFAGGGAAALTAAALLLLLWMNSSGFEKLVRARLIAAIQSATGGQVEIASFHWRPLDLEAEAGGLVLHGREASNEAPYAKIDLLRVQISVLGFFSPRILLRDLEITRPALHLIVYPDGSTNQPSPARPHAAGKGALNKLFDLHARRVALEEGTLDYENRAAKFDFQNRHIPLNFAANDVSLRMAYVPAQGNMPESYRIDTGARDLQLTRGGAEKPVAAPVAGYLQATLDLARNALYLRSLRLTARGKGVPDRTIAVSGSLLDFTRPTWKATAQGDLDTRLLEPITGYPNCPEGIAHVNLTAEGGEGQFRIDGPVHVEDGAYVASGVSAHGVTLDAHVHADPERLLISSVIARLRQGGQLEGTVALEHWLHPVPGSSAIEAAAPASAPANHFWRFGRKREAPRAAVQPAAIEPGTIPINGNVTAQLRNVTIDTVLDIVGEEPFKRLGIDGQLDGPATATWMNGDTRTLAVGARLDVHPSARPVPGESPATGTIDGTYRQRDGSVDLRTLELSLPASHILAQGHLGAYPMKSPTAISVAFRSTDLGEFDKVLRDLGLQREGKIGVGALPASLGGEAEFHGAWSGSLIDPLLTGEAKATNLTIELPAHSADKTAKPEYVHWDSIDANGSYSAARITIDRSLFVRGQSTLALEGSLTAQPVAHPHAGTPVFDANSQLRLHLNATGVDVADLYPFIGRRLPLTGRLNAQLDSEGALHSLDGSGWVELNQGALYGEPVAGLRAQGKITGQVIQLSALTLSHDAGRLTASGSYDMKARQFQIAAHGAGIDVSKIHLLKESGAQVDGSMDFTLTGAGSINDPHLEGQGTLTELVVDGEHLGNVKMTAHIASHNLLYDLSTQFESASLVAHGQTALSGQYSTSAQLDFSKFNIGALLKMTGVPQLTGESQLAGSIKVEGPLAQPEQLRGDAILQNLAVAIAGVHLHGEGPVHASLAGSRVTLDPIHVMGEETDLRARGNLDLKNDRRLDLIANGSINLKLAETLDPDLTASGTTTFELEAHGPLQNPGLQGRVNFENSSLALEDLPNSLSQLHGTLELNQNRLEVKSLTATTGGGQLSVSGYLAYQRGLFADLTMTGKGVRIRYPEGVSSLADAKFQLQGTPSSLLLSGGIMITRFSVSPDLDIAGLANQANKMQTIAAPDAPSNHVRLDVRIQSSPQLNFQNAYAKLAGDVDLHLRGTLATPSLLGRISVTEGNATIAGTRYELQRGDITFTNPVRIEPAIDLNATARVEDYDITLGLHGSPSKMNVSYRSDPPLPEADVVALLALGRTQNEQQIYGQQQERVAANPTTEALLGGALNASVSSRVQRLFGAGAVKVDPNYLGVLGNSTTRITVEEQLGKNLTLTYATDVNTTAQQFLQAEVAINRHVSLLIARDESGVFSMVIKATRRYR
ncbi:MAG: translocation/assembly module TamB domain-containing protein [Terracidiphilus sp.]